MAGAALRLKIVKPIFFPSQALSRSGSKGMISAGKVFSYLSQALSYYNLKLKTLNLQLSQAPLKTHRRRKTTQKNPKCLHYFNIQPQFVCKCVLSNVTVLYSYVVTVLFLLRAAQGFARFD